MALLSFIIIGLVLMFSQTQRAFKQSLTDADLLENGRAVMELMVRDLAEAAPADVSNAVNFYVEFPQPTEPIYTPPLLQALPGTAAPPQLWTNYLQPFFFLSRPNEVWPDRTWAGIGYYVVPDVPGVSGVGIGTLYRYAATNDTLPALPGALITPASILTPRCFLMDAFPNSFASAVLTMRTDTSPAPLTAPMSAVTRIADGVVDLRVRPFATNGFPIVSDLNPLSYGYTVFLANFISNGVYESFPQQIIQATNHLNTRCPDAYDSCWFFSNAMPAYVELELGILESQTYQSYKAIVSANPAAAAAFLSNHVAQVHLFRQRVPIHNVDPSAY